jgi:hypothetical protein
MKKIITALLCSISLSAYAGSISIELQDLDSKNGVSDMRGMIVTVRDDITKNLAADISVVGIKLDSTQAISNRVEVGLVTKLNPYVSVRTAVGERYTGQKDYSYYSINPSITVPFGQSNFSGSLGWRYRSAFDSVNNDRTRSWRTGLNYNLNKNHRVGIAYYIVNGTIEQNNIGVNYVRSF